MNPALVVDVWVLRRLEADIADAAAFCAFVARFSSLLPVRIDRIRDALLVRDRDALRHAALNLQASSAMIGATALAGQVEAVLRTRAPEVSATMGWPRENELCELVCRLRVLAQETIDVLNKATPGGVRSVSLTR